MNKNKILILIFIAFVLGTIVGMCVQTVRAAESITVESVTEICSVTEETTTEETTVEETTEVPLTTIKAEDVPELKDLGTFQYFWYCREEYPHICNDGAPYLTKMETKPTDKTVAVDPNVVPLGSTLYINGEYYKAEDTGGNIKGNRIDFNCASHSQALQNGKGYVKVFLVVE